MAVSRKGFQILSVTLHVSVWVEISAPIAGGAARRHAPRERVSWNGKDK